MKQVHDMIGREIKLGDVLAVGQRSGNSGALDIRVVAGFKVTPPQYSWEKEDSITIKTTVGGYLQHLDKVLVIPPSLFKGTEKESYIEEELAKVPNA